MPLIRQERGADSPWVERVTRVVSTARTEDVTTPDGCWDLVMTRHQAQVSVLQTGVITRPVALDFSCCDEYVCARSSRLRKCGVEYASNPPWSVAACRHTAQPRPSSRAPLARAGRSRTSRADSHSRECESW